MNRKFSFLVSKFLTWASKCLSPITCSVYKHYFKKFVDEVGDLRVGRITPSKITGWAKTWHQSQAIVRLFRWACLDAQLIKSNPINRVKHPPKGCRRRVATSAEQTRIFRAAAVDLRALLIGYRETMARPGELRAATWGDVYPKTTRVELRKALEDGRGMIVLTEYKNRKARRLANAPRVILLSPRVGRMLSRMIDGAIALEGPIFKTAKGRTWTSNAVRCRLRRLRKSLGLKRDARGENIVPYTFRHTGATMAAAAGIRDRILADALGHIETSTTARYQHLDTEHIRAALQKLWQRRAA